MQASTSEVSRKGRGDTGMAIRGKIGGDGIGEMR
jgi:hypothetical protein